MRWLFLLLLSLLTYATDIPSPEDNPPPLTEEVKPEASPLNLSSDIYQKQFFRTLIVALIVIVGAVLLIWLMRKFSKERPLQMNHRKNLKILERRQISPNTYLYHMQIGSKQFVISESKSEVRLITTLDWDESETPNT